MDALTANEVSALLGLDQRSIRKEVEHGIVATGSPPRFDLVAVVYLRTVFSLGVELGSIKDRQRLYELIRAAMGMPKPPATVQLSPIAEIKIGTILREVEERAKRFEAWKRQLVIDDHILGGEPVFPKSRLAVRHVGGMRLRGVAVKEIQEDYPYLKADDIEFAEMYAAAYPRMGRPREPEASSR
jgi:uncharacterized protein (DUF433 family)